MIKQKTIVFIPPNGEIFVNDFSIQRICHNLKKKKQIKTILLKLDTIRGFEENFDYVDLVIDVKTQKELIKKLKEIKPDLIFHRSWMHAYSFAAKLVKKFDNVIVNIKDWEFASKKEYAIVFGEEATKDFKAIKYIMKNAKLILSHYTKEQAKIWAKKYKVNKKKFVFFPEFCNEENFFDKKVLDTDTYNIAFAGSLSPTSYPEEFFIAKPHLRSVRCLTKQNIDVSYVLVEGSYAATQSPKQRLLFQDVLYENQFNDKFHLVKGKQLDSSVLSAYHYGFFHLEDCVKKQNLTRYAVPSKFAFYLEAGLPMIINRKMKGLSKLVKKYGLGVVFDNNEIDDLAIKLKSISTKEYKGYISNINLFRKRFIFKSSNLDKILKIN